MSLSLKKFFGVGAALVAVGLFALYCGSDGGGGNPGGSGGDDNDGDTPTATTYTLTTSANPGIGGTVSPEGTTTHKADTTVTIRAVAEDGYVFVNWTGAGVASANSATTTVSMSQNRNVTANFRLLEDGEEPPTTYTLIVSATTGGTVSPAGASTYNADTLITITATAASGYAFVNWTGEGVTDPNSATTTVTMSEDRTVTANFEALSAYTITYDGNGNTGGTAPTDNAQYLSGSAVTVLGAGNLTKTDHVFSGWNTEADGSGNSFVAGNTFNITENTTLYARWVDVSIPIFTVTVNSVGTGSTGNGDYEEGATIHISAGIAPAGQQFVNWTTTSDGVTFANANSATTTFTMPANAVMLTANFEPIPTYEVIVSSAGTGATGAGNYIEGATVSISAGTAPAGHRFVNWTTTSEGVTFANADNIATTFTMPANTATVTANFELIPSYEVTISSIGIGVTGEDNYVQGARVSISAGTAPAGYRFVNWTTTSDGVTFTNANNIATTFIMPANAVTVTANFELLTYTLTTNATPTIGGSTIRNPDQTSYNHGATVTVSATPADGYRFTRWTGALTSTSSEMAITMDDNKTLTANFELIPTYAVTVSSVGTSATGAGNYIEGATVDISAGVAPAGQRFVNWTTTSAGVTFANANNATTTFTMPANAVIVTANFEVITYAVTISSAGTGATSSGNYAQGATVSIFAGTPPANHTFKNWTTTSAGITFANANNATTTFTMPANAVNITANFELLWSIENSFVQIANGVSFKMVAVEGGTFTMGCTAEQVNDCPISEHPTSQVTLSSFYIGEFEVTQELWTAVMGTNPSFFTGTNLPVANVSWNDIVNDFLPALNALTGRTYRLPTEAEWEYAARGGHRATITKYAGSNNINDVAWYIANSNNQNQPVGGKEPNELGLYDMSGNVWEWVHDWSGSYTSIAKTNPTGTATNEFGDRVVRGGSSGLLDRYARVSGTRVAGGYNIRDARTGFRLVVSVE